MLVDDKCLKDRRIFEIQPVRYVCLPSWRQHVQPLVSRRFDDPMPA